MLQFVINVELKNLTNNSKSVLLLLLSLCLLLAAQQFADVHELEVFGSEHHHTAECPVCAFDSNGVALDSQATFSLQGTLQSLRDQVDTFFLNAENSGYHARAPPTF